MLRTKTPSIGKAPAPLQKQLQQLKSRHPFVPAALKLLNDPTQQGTSVAQYAKYRWSIKWQEITS